MFKSNQIRERMKENERDRVSHLTGQSINSEKYEIKTCPIIIALTLSAHTQF